MTPTILSRAECRAWLRAMTLKGVRLPKTPNVLYVEQPSIGIWRIVPYESGGFSVHNDVVWKKEKQR